MINVVQVWLCDCLADTAQIELEQLQNKQSKFCPSVFCPNSGQHVNIHVLS